jgi:O-antigen/teichoic acid export membrane protein
MRRWLETLATPGSLRHVIAHSASVFALRAFALLVLFATMHVLYQTVGVASYGAYATAQSWLVVLTIPALLGLDQLVLRESAALHAHGQIDRLHALLRWARRTVLLSACSVAAAALATVCILFALGIGDRETLVACAFGFVALPWMALAYVRQGALRGLHHVTLGFLPELVVTPVLTIVGILLAGVLLRHYFSAPLAMLIAVVAVLPAYYLGIALLQRHLPPAGNVAPPGEHARAWLRCAVPLMLVSVMYVLINRADILLLNLLDGKQAVGLYDPARKFADCIGFILVTVNAAMAPSIARLHAQRNHTQLQRMVTWSARGIMLVALPVTLLLMIFGRHLLGWLSHEVQPAAPLLTILCLGQLINAATGSVGMLLTTTGYERDAVLGIGIGAAVNIGANLVLIPWCGAYGAAWAFVLSMLTWNGLLAWFVYRRLQLHSTCLGSFPWRRT